MTPVRGPLLLLLLCAVLAVTSGYAIPIHKTDVPPPTAYDGAFVFGPGGPSTDNWLGGTGNWSDAWCWSRGLPLLNHNVYIDSGGTDLVYLNMSAAIASLTLGGNRGSSELTSKGNYYLIISGAFTVNQSGLLYLHDGNTLTAARLANSGAIDLENASTVLIYGNATLTNNSSLNVSRSSQAEFGSLGNNGGIGLSGNGSLVVHGNATNSGTISTGGSGNNTVSIGGTLTNSGSFELGGSNDLATVSSIVNSGRVFLGNGSTTTASTLQVNGDMTNDGSVQVGQTCWQWCSAANLINIGGTLTNRANGVVTIGAPTPLYLGPPNTISTGGLSNEGTVHILNGSSLLVSGDASNSGLIELGYTGCLSCNGNATLKVEGTLTNTGNINLLQLTWGPYGNDRVELGGLVNSGTYGVYSVSTTTVHGDVTNSGAINLDPSDTDQMPNSSIGLDIGGGLYNSGSLSLIGHPWDQSSAGAGVGGNISNTGTIDLWDYARLQVSGDVNNSGSIASEGYFSGCCTNNAVGIAGTLTNTGGFSLGFQGSWGDYGDIGRIINSGSIGIGWGTHLTVHGDVTNSGMIATKNGGNTVTIGGALNNSSSGSFLMNGESDQATIENLNNSGAINLENSSILTVQGDAINSGGLSTGGSGNNTVNIGGTLINSGEFLLGGPNDSATIASLVNLSHVDLQKGSTVQVSGDAVNLGGVIAFSADCGYGPCRGSEGMNVAGRLTNSGFIGIDGTSTLSVTGSMTNSGVLETSAFCFVPDCRGGNYLNIGGTLVNTSTGSLRIGISSDTDFSHAHDLINAGGLANDGTIAILGGSTLQVAGDAYNSGTIEFGCRVLSCTDGVSFMVSGTLVNAGNITRLESIIPWQADIINLGGMVNSGTFEIARHAASINIGSLTNSGSIYLDGDVNGEYAPILTAGSLINAGSVGLQDYATLTVSGNAVNLGSITLSSQGQNGSPSVTFNGGLTNSGSISLWSYSKFVAGGSVDNSGYIGIDHSGLYVSHTLTNEAGGGFSVAGTVPYASDFVETLTNRGDVSISAARFQVGGDVQNSGSFSTGNGSTVSINGALNNNLGGSFALNGQADQASVGSLNNGGSINLGGGSTLQVFGDANNSGSMYVGESCDGPCALNSINIAGTLTNTSTGLLWVGGASPSDYGPPNALTAGGLSNRGTINILNGSGLVVNGDASNSGTISLGVLDCLSCEGNTKLKVGGTLFNTGDFEIYSPPAALVGDEVDLGALVNLGIYGAGFTSSTNVVGDVVNSGVNLPGTIHLRFGSERRFECWWQIEQLRHTVLSR